MTLPLNHAKDFAKLVAGQKPKKWEHCYCHELFSWDDPCDVCLASMTPRKPQPMSMTTLRNLGTRQEWTTDAIATACILAFLVALPFTLATVEAIVSLFAEGKLL